MDVEYVQFPLHESGSEFKRTLKVLLGRMLGWWMPSRRERVRRGELGTSLTRIDRLMIAALVSHHEQTGTMGALVPLHQWLWKSGQAMRFHEQAEARFDAWWTQHDAIVLDAIHAQIESAPGRYDTFCEIGCGSGRVMADVGQRLEGPGRFIGLDLSPGQTERNRQRYTDPRYAFETGDATEWILAHGGPGWIYFTNAGVLEYLAQAQVERMFSDIARRQSPSMIALVEPLPDDFDLTRETASRAYGPERSMAHNYLKLLADAGWSVRWTQENVFDDQRHLLVVAVTAS